MGAGGPRANRWARPFRVAAGVAVLMAVPVACSSSSTTTSAGSTSSITSAASTTANTATTTAAPAFPVDVQNCGQTLHFDQAPKAVVSMDQVATEALLGLGAGDAVKGTANEASPIWDTYKAAYDKIPVLADGGYPSKEVLLGASPDLVVGNLQFFTYSGFPPGSNFTRDELAAKSIKGFTLRCDDDTEVTQDLLYQRYVQLGQIFGRKAQAEAFVKQVKDGIAATGKSLQNTTPVSTFYYSGGQGPLGTYGQAQEGLVLSGGKNLFADQPALVGGMPPTVSAEQVVQRNPAAILVEDTGALDPSEPSVQQKIDYLTKALASTDAVKNKRFCTVDFYDFQGGLRTVAAVKKVAQCLHPDVSF